MSIDNQTWKSFINITDKEKNDENLLLGEHTLILVSGDNPNEAFFKLEG